MTAIPYYTQGPGGPPRMRYWAAYRFVWTSPSGWKNLLLASVCMLIPIIGPLVLIGYMRDVLLARLDTLDDDRIGYPDFDFNHFVDYLMRGVWPFLVSLVAGLAVSLVCAATVLPLVLIPALKLRGAAEAVVIGIVVLVSLAATVLGTAATLPLTLRAAILEDFAPAFSWVWVKDFLRRAWPETLLATLFTVATSVPVVMIGWAMCFVGVYAAVALVTIAQWHLHFQVYRIYLSRGGTPVPPKPAPPRSAFAVGAVPLPVIPVAAAPPPLPPR